ncbi:galactomannan galactosyltransferase 1-like [Wolffia australiana]
MDTRPPRSLRPSILANSFLFAGISSVSLLLFWALYAVVGPAFSPFYPFPSNPSSSSSSSSIFTPSLSCPSPSSPSPSPPNWIACEDLRHDPPSPTFYDDPLLSYGVGSPVQNWDDKRRAWLDLHPSFKPGAERRILMISGSQPKPCRNRIGDHLLLRFFKNKADYCRIHGLDFFYNTALLHPDMFTYWAKIPVVRAAMVAHPESEWLWWVDSDAIFTDMEFELPLRKYEGYNLVAHGWRHLVYENRSWTSLNAGVFLLRNCQWSVDFLEAWAEMGPQSPDYERWGKTLKAEFKDKVFPESDDQSALVYLLLRQGSRWGDKIYLESEYYFQGYWVEIVGKLKKAAERYAEMERRAAGLRRRRAEKVAEAYGAAREEILEAEGWRAGLEGLRRPFVTHFTGCQPCSGRRNEGYSNEDCWKGMRLALNFADDQVLRHYGFAHRDLLTSDSVRPLAFDFPA